MGLVSRKSVLSCPHCRERNREHISVDGVKLRVLPSWPYLSVCGVAGQKDVLVEITHCPWCGRALVGNGRKGGCGNGTKSI